MLRNFIAAAILLFISIAPVNAQSQRGTWIQVEELNSQQEAMDRILVYKTLLPSIAGFLTQNGKYAVLVGPFSTLESQFLLTQFRQTGLIPADSFVSTTEDFAAQFYPEIRVISPTAPKDSGTVSSETETPTTIETPAEPPAEEPQESISQARASERLLTKDQKKLLQVALKDAGHYTGAIDGLYGRGTRASMTRWQNANGYDATGVLTTSQRAQLLAQYYVLLDGLGMTLVEDRQAGITIEMPTTLVAFDGYTAPFAHYRPTGADVAEVHLISQPGDRTSLYALYDVMQTLSIVPIDGRRKKNRNNFVLTGQNDRILSHTEAYLSGGQIKGFTVVWPADQPEQFELLIERMTTSFETTSAVLPRGAGTDIEPGQETLAGLDLRQATAVVSGVFINDSGTILTTSQIDGQCERIAALDDADYDISVHAPEFGVSVLSPKTSVSPIGFGKIKAVANRIDTSISLAGYSFGGALNAPTLTHGSIVATSGLQGEAHLDRLSLSHFASDAGGPVLGPNGEIVGLLNARDTSSGRQLPSDVSFMTDNSALSELLKNEGIDHTLSVALSTRSGVQIERMAREMTVWVSCWE